MVTSLSARSHCRWIHAWWCEFHVGVIKLSEVCFTSNLLPITMSVPQGSIWSPVLFTSNINNVVPLLSFVPKCFSLLYADNTIVYCNSKFTWKVPSAYRQHLSSFIQHLSSLLSFILNLPWTHQNLSGHYSQILHGSPIERLSVYVYLSIWIDGKIYI